MKDKNALNSMSVMDILIMVKHGLQFNVSDGQLELVIGDEVNG